MREKFVLYAVIYDDKEIVKIFKRLSMAARYVTKIHEDAQFHYGIIKLIEN